MSDEQIKWLDDNLPQIEGRTIYGKTLSTLYTAEMYLDGATKIKKRDCPCNLQGLHDSVFSKYYQWKQRN